jgi:O-antigen biosynthesis protein WbqP
MKSTTYSSWGKRGLDIILASVALLILSPIMLLTGFAIRIYDGGPAFFRQTRLGQRGHLFEVMKFRSMPINTGDIASANAHSLEITPIGKFIRRTNIDELPQLINIFRGDMSIVGPRPALPSQTELYTLREATGAMACKPGLTGLAQINSYDDMPEAEKARWDGMYTSNISFIGDLKIIFKTFGYLTRRPPVY